MKDSIVIKRSIIQHQDIMDACEHYSSTYGTGAQTLCVLVRKSPLYQEWQKLQAAQAEGKDTKDE